MRRISTFVLAFVLALTAGLVIACSKVEVPQRAEYTVTYHYNYTGSPDNDIYRTDKYYAGAVAEAPTTKPTRAGYTWADWTVGAAEDSASYDFSKALKANLDLYAQWTKDDQPEDPKVTGLEITNNKAKYTVGDELDIKVKAVYDNGKKEDLKADDYTVTGYDKNKKGDQTVTVTLKANTAISKTLTVKVEEAPVVDAKITKIDVTANKTEYEIGEALDITVMAEYDKGEPKELKADDYTVEGYDNTKAGDCEVIVTLKSDNKITDKVNVKVKEAPVEEAKITAIKVTANKTEYEIGEALDITVMAEYDKGEPKELNAADYTVEGYDNTKAGDCEVIVTLKSDNKITDTVTVTVNEPTVIKIELDTKNVKKDYIVGEELDLTDLVVTAYYSNNTHKEVTDYTYSGYDKESIREQTITIIYANDKKATFKVTVRPGVTQQFDMSFDANIAETFADKIVDLPGTIKVDKDSTASEPDEPTLKGFTFGGWYKEETCETAWDFDNDTVTEKVELYAKWTAKTYTVSYTLNGGTNGNNPATYKATDGNNVTLISATLAYNTPGGWYTAQTGGTKVETLNYDLIPASATATEIKLYARFTPETYNITYELGGSASTYTAVLSEDAPKQYTYGKTTTLPGVDDITVTTADGVDVPYVFMHWYVQGDETKTEVDTTSGMNGKKTFVALIEQKTTFIFTFDYGYDHNGDGKTTYSRNIVENELAINRDLSTLGRVGYTFDGWYTDKTWATQYVFSTPVTAKTTIFAKWTAIDYTIVYSGAGVTTTNPTSYKITNADTTLDTNPTLTEGYYFDGWFFDSEYSVEAVKLDKDIIGKAVEASGVYTITIYAKSSNIYNVKYDTNRPTGVTESTSNRPADTTVVYGNAITGSKIPTLTDYACRGWYTAATCDCEGACTHVWDFATLVNSTTATFDATHTLTLYARWYKKVVSGKYVVGGFNDWQNFDKRADAADYLAEAQRIVTESGKQVAKEWKITGLTLKAEDTFKFLDYNKATNKITWNTPYDISACNVRPAAAMSIEITKDGQGNPENYKIATYALGEGNTWTVEFGTNKEGNNYVTFTLDGYIGWRNPDDGTSGEEYAPADDFALEDGEWYLTGNFNGWFLQNDLWSTKSEKAYKRNTTYMFTNVYLKKYDTLKIMNKAGTWLGFDTVNGSNFSALGTPIKLASGDNNNIALNTLEDGYYNIVFSYPATGDKTLTINKYVPVEISLKAGSNIYVGDELKNDETTKALLTVTADGTAVAAGNYTVLQSTAVAGENVLRVIYKGGVFSYTYTAKTPQITAISVNTAPTKKWYFVGDTLSTAGLKINLTYDKTSLNTTTAAGDVSLFNVTATLVGRTEGELRLGNTVEVTVTLKSNANVSTTFNVNVLNKVTQIAVTTDPTKTTYYVGDELDTTGMVVTVYFNGGTTLSAVASGTPTTTPANGATLTADDDEITVSYTQYKPDGCNLTMPTCTTSVDITVKEPQITTVAVAGTLEKSTYKVGDTFSGKGLTFTATKQNGATVPLSVSDMTFTIASEYANASNMFIKAGTTIPVTVKYGDTTITGKNVTVNVENKPTGLSIDATELIKPHAAGFVEGDALSDDGIKVYHIYNQGIDGATVITDTQTVTHGNLTFSIAIGTELTAGEHEITVWCADNVKGTFTITVLELAVTDFKVTGTAALQYKNAEFDSTGLTFTATYNNDDVDSGILADAVTFTCDAMVAGKFTTAGNYTMTAEFGGKSDEFAFEVAEAEGYTVTFRLNVPNAENKTAGNWPGTKSVAHGDTVAQPAANPTLKGYVFGGWYAEATCTTTYDFSAAITGNKNVYAKWTSKTYTIVYDVDGVANGTYAATANLFPNAALAPATKAGHEFKGWCKLPALTDAAIENMTYARLPANADETSLTQTISLYAKFDPISYAVKFIVDGDEVEDWEQSIKYNNYATKPETDPSIDHYEFAFWSIGEREDTTATEFNFTTTPITGPVTLYAHWTAIRYTVNYGLITGATNNEANPATYSDADESPKALQDPTAPAGKKFKEWQYNGAKVTALTHSMLPESKTGTIELTAVFDTIVYVNVSFDLDYEVAEGVEKVTTVQVEKGKAVEEPADPERTNWTFKWWYVDSDATESEYTFGDAVNSNITLKAKWERITVIVSFNLNYGTTPTVIQKTVNKGDDAVVPEDDRLNRDGYQLLGWYTEAACTNVWNFTDNPVNASRTLYAKWQKLTGAYLVIGTDKHELTDNSESSSYALEYMKEGLELSKNDVITFTVDGTTVTLTIDTASHGITASGTTAIKITDNGTYSFYLHKGLADEVWTIYATYAEYVDYYYLVGILPNNDSYKWATVNPIYKLSADNTITIPLEVNNEFKIAHADGNAIRWSGELGYKNLTDESKSVVGGSDNITIHTKGKYTISVVEVNGKTMVDISREGVERPDESGRVTVDTTSADNHYLVFGTDAIDTTKGVPMTPNGGEYKLLNYHLDAGTKFKFINGTNTYTCLTIEASTPQAAKDALKVDNTNEYFEVLKSGTFTFYAKDNNQVYLTFTPDDAASRTQTIKLKFNDNFECTLKVEMPEDLNDYKRIHAWSGGVTEIAWPGYEVKKVNGEYVATIGGSPTGEWKLILNDGNAQTIDIIGIAMENGKTYTLVLDGTKDGAGHYNATFKTA